MIGDDVEIVVTRIEHDTVKIGVIAPRERAVFRNEIYNRIRESNIAAVRDSNAEVPSIQLPPRKP